jgi:hypothetical protein
MKNLRTISAVVLVTAALTTLLLLALAGETETTTAAFSYPADTAVEEVTAPETTVPETTVPETEAPETTVPETTAPETTAPETVYGELPPLLPLGDEEVESVISATLSRKNVPAAVADGKEVRILRLTAISVSDNGYATFKHGEYAFSVRCPQNTDLSQPVIVYFILG